VSITQNRDQLINSLNQLPFVEFTSSNLINSTTKNTS
jgi:hypothetical protein